MSEGAWGAGRLAPTPSGDLHLGNVVAFTAAWLSARAAGDRLLLRFEDVDRGRARQDIEDRQREDLAWLGLTWDEEVPPQRTRDYQPWLARLHGVYTCGCTRASIRDAGGRHPTACRRTGAQRGALRFALPDVEVQLFDRVHGPRRVHASTYDDPVLRRRDGIFTYNLAVVVDDLVDGVTQVVRGADLLDYSAVQALLWEALGATPPSWLHTPLILGPDGRKLSKSHGAAGVRALREAGVSAADVLRAALRWLGQPDERLTPEGFDPAKIPTHTLQLDPDDPLVARPWIDDRAALR